MKSWKEKTLYNFTTFYRECFQILQGFLHPQHWNMFVLILNEKFIASDFQIMQKTYCSISANGIRSIFVTCFLFLTILNLIFKFYNTCKVAFDVYEIEFSCNFLIYRSWTQMKLLSMQMYHLHSKLIFVYLNKKFDLQIIPCYFILFISFSLVQPQLGDHSYEILLAARHHLCYTSFHARGFSSTFFLLPSCLWI